MYMHAWPLTVSLDIETEGGLQLADVIADADVQAVDANRGEGVVQFQGVSIQHGQCAAPHCVWHTVRQETPAHPHGRTTDTQKINLRYHEYIISLYFDLKCEMKMKIGRRIMVSLSN